ncbi:MAG: hypothetical protein OEZ06_18850 [Myxococcales bacterium]|nr:hypothetical protein [Myxococcales bacterium]
MRRRSDAACTALAGFVASCLVVGQPASALACAVCFSAKDEANRDAFLTMTAFMTLLPLAMLGGALYWVVRRMRAIDEQQSLPAPGESVSSSD